MLDVYPDRGENRITLLGAKLEGLSAEAVRINCYWTRVART
jgi:hypothetical protein